MTSWQADARALAIADAAIALVRIVNPLNEARTPNAKQLKSLVALSLRSPEEQGSAKHWGAEFAKGSGDLTNNTRLAVFGAGLQLMIEDLISDTSEVRHAELACRYCLTMFVHLLGVHETPHRESHNELVAQLNSHGAVTFRSKPVTCKRIVCVGSSTPPCHADPAEEREATSARGPRAARGARVDAAAAWRRCVRLCGAPDLPRCAHQPA